MRLSRRKALKHMMGLSLTAGSQNRLWASLDSSKSTAVNRHPVNAELRENLLRIDQVMRAQGIQRDSNTGRAYFSGHSYKTLYDWDPYFEGILQLELGWDPKYMINGVKIFLDIQRADGFIRRVNDPSRREEADEMKKPFLARISVLIRRKLGIADWLDDNYYQRVRRFVRYWLSALSKDKPVTFQPRGKAIRIPLDKSLRQEGIQVLEIR